MFGRRTPEDPAPDAPSATTPTGAEKSAESAPRPTPVTQVNVTQVTVKMAALSQRSEINTQYQVLRSETATKDSVLAFRRLYDVLDSGSAPMLRDEILTRLLKKEQAAKLAGVDLQPLPSAKFKELVWPPKYFVGRVPMTEEGRKDLDKKITAIQGSNRPDRISQVRVLGDQLKKAYVIKDNDVQRAKTVAAIALWAAEADYTPPPKF